MVGLIPSLCLLLMVVVDYASGNHLQDANKTAACLYNTSLPTIYSDAELQKECCRYIYDRFIRDWYWRTDSLGNLLETLKKWDCPQFREECVLRTFAFTDYTNLAYHGFCNASKFFSLCKADLERIYDLVEAFLGSNEQDGFARAEASGLSPTLDLLPKNMRGDDGIALFEGTGPNSTNTMENVASKNLDGVWDLLSLKQQRIPCVQAAAASPFLLSSGEYYEIKVTDFPFCDISWCAFRAETFKEHVVTLATCIPDSCRLRLYVFMTAAGILGLMIIFCNANVLVIIATNRRLWTSQGIYRCSLGAADLLVGLFVCPGIIEAMQRQINTKYDLIQTGSMANPETVLSRKPYSSSLIDFCGFFTTLSLMVSINTLMLASFDRLLVVYRPLEYEPFKARSISKKAVSALWILGSVLSIIPVFTPGGNYKFIATIFAALDGEVALAVYTILFAIPLIILWAVTIATLVFCKRNAKVQVALHGQEAKKVSVEIQLAKTLSIMAGFFTLCLVPVCAVVLAELFVDGINFGRPADLDGSKASLFFSLEAATGLLLLSNSLWNFFIYNARSKEFRKAYLSLYSRIARKAGLTFLCRAGFVRKTGTSFTTSDVSSRNISSNLSPPTTRQHTF